MSDSKEPSTLGRDGTQPPPTSIVGIMGRLGPGLIIAGSIVGSGELIATTKTGAEAGFLLLWLITIGCVIKIFSQVELGRYSVVTGGTAMDCMNEVPGPRLAGRGNWVVWFWLLMFLAGLAQLGGIVAGVGQALQISVPITEDGRRYNEVVDTRTKLKVTEAELRLWRQRTAENGNARNEIVRVKNEVAELKQRVVELGDLPDVVYDDRIWATIVTVITSLMLVVGRYRFIQAFSLAIVGLFTLITIINLILLQMHPVWSVSWSELADGWRFRAPPPNDDATRLPLATALATFGIIGVGAAELVQYPYWCLEKGYARFTGPRDDTSAWADRARGWMRVMRFDAWCSLAVFTFVTIAFYLLGAAILWRVGLNPMKDEMVRTLSVMYEPVFGRFAQWLFLFGAFAVLYSTFFVATAGYARVFPDALRVISLGPKNEKSYRTWVRVFCGLLPFVCLFFHLRFPYQPVVLILISGVMQAMMLPMLATAALYFRYRRCDRRLTPGKTWDLFLWLSALGMLVAGAWALWENVQRCLF
jgi:Mn2+/Fe2+ NRAMP family transporter